MGVCCPNAFGLVRTVHQIPQVTPSGFDFLFRTRPRALGQQTPPELFLTPETTPTQDWKIRLHLLGQLWPPTRTAAETPGCHHTQISAHTVTNCLGNLHSVLDVYIQVVSFKAAACCKAPQGEQRSLVSLPAIGNRSLPLWVQVLSLPRWCVGQGVVSRRGMLCLCLHYWRGPMGQWECDGLEDGWFGIHSHGRDGLVVLNGTFNVESYEEKMIQPEVVPYAQRDGIFQQTNVFPLSICLTQDSPISKPEYTLPFPC